MYLYYTLVFICGHTSSGSWIKSTQRTKYFYLFFNKAIVCFKFVPEMGLHFFICSFHVSTENIKYKFGLPRGLPPLILTTSTGFFGIEAPYYYAH